HSWVEVYFPDLGWQIFDPTPVAQFDERARLRLGAQLRGWLDLAGLRWRTLVLDYDQQAQLDAVQRAYSGMGNPDPAGFPSISIPELAGKRGRTLGGIGGLAAALALIALGLFVRWALLRWRDSTAAWGDVPPGISRRFVRLSRRALSRLQRRLGDEQGPHPTAREITAEASRRAPVLAGDLDILAERYYAVRFGGRRASQEDLQAARIILSSVRRIRRGRMPGRGAGSAVSIQARWGEGGADRGM
ncbi:MAG: DUF4129 domain-containing protein, partial [Myxococcota bacterium]|nr:DUF4129 domain-containing protein [Myxococcota bacterium]